MLIKRKYLFGTTILAGVMAVAAPAFAQQLPGVTVQGQSDQEATEIGEVVVTGSRIRRDPTNAPTPLILVSGDDLLNTGQNTVIDYLATIPALSNSRVPSDTVDVFSQGVGFLGISAPNLRALGAGRTLTLIDGRRQVGSVGGSLSVDVDTIPRLLIENIEIVTGGASSVYGADAVSGVLNFVLRKDFEGLEVDLNAAQINQGGQASYRASVLGGVNLLDDRLNLWAFAEYEHIDAIKSLDLDWLQDSWGLVAIDADPTAAPNDGNWDSALFNNLGSVGRRPGGVTTLANNQAASPLNNPLIPFFSCDLSLATNGYNNGNCYAVNPGKTFLYEGNTARLANFGQRIGNTGLSRTLVVGGDASIRTGLTFEDRTPEQTSQRYAVGANFSITPNIMLSLEAKYVTEDSFANSQPVFFDVLLNDARTRRDRLNRWWVDTATPGYNTFNLNYVDNAFLPQVVKDAITGNTIQNYNAPTANTPGTLISETAAPYARHQLFGPQRGQDQNRELQRYVAALRGDLDQVFVLKNINWEVSYVYGEVDNTSIETSVDVERYVLAADAIVDTAGVVNGRPGEIVCRSQVLAKTLAAGLMPDMIRGGDMRSNPFGLAAINECKPMNIFGEGNASAESLAYAVNGSTQTIRERNEQEQAIAFVSGELWDFFGAGPIGVAVGGEYRREYTDASGRADHDDLFLFGLQGPDFTGVEYESEEAFAELSIPLFRDSWLGQYAEVSGSYRYFDYTTAGTGDVYGVNLVYRPIRDIGFKTSFNTSFRAPNLGENFSPFSQTFSNGWVDPCTTANITAPGLTAEIRANRIKNCEALAVADGFAAGFFDFAGTTATTQDDFVQNATSISGVSGGNPNLQPETSESFTFTTVLEPRFIPNFSLVLDYYEIRIDNVISAVTVNQAAALCVDGPSLSTACNTLFRDAQAQSGSTNSDRSSGFQLGGSGPGVPGFIQGSVNFAASQTRGLDFTANYSLDSEEVFGRNWGRFDYSLRGLWLIEQKQFTNPANAAAFTEFASNPGSPRVRFSSSLTWSPTDALSINWTADWQTGQDSVRIRDQIASNNLDSRLMDYYSTGDFTRHDFTVRYRVNEQVAVRAGVTNAFDAEQARYLGGTLQDNYDPYGTRFFIGLNYRPW
jgi:outer membrane receptor protein involved in Fe transport